LDGKLYFAGRLESSSEFTLLVTDGTPEGTRSLETGVVEPWGMKTMGDKIIFRASSPYYVPACNEENPPFMALTPQIYSFQSGSAVAIQAANTVQTCTGYHPVGSYFQNTQNFISTN